VILGLKIVIEDNSAHSTLSLKVMKLEILKRKFILDQLISQNFYAFLRKLFEEKKKDAERVGENGRKKRRRKIEIDYIDFLRDLIRKRPGKLEKIIFFVQKDGISDPDFVMFLSYVQALFGKKIKIIPSDRYELHVEFDIKFFALMSSIISTLLRGRSKKVES
jgi:hypothetical protein